MMKTNILQFLEDTVERFPDKCALIEGEKRLIFRDLKRISQTIASKISKLNTVNKPIAVFLPKSIECIVSDIAISYSSNIYMNLDIKMPALRITSILERISPVGIITNYKYLDIVKSLSPNCMIFIYEEMLVSTDNIEIYKPWLKLIDTDPLCIINTSGSTGTPKGVVLNHRSYIDYLEWAISTFNFTENEILGVLSPVVFDHYNYEISLMMAKGCTLVLLDNQMASFPVKILETLKEHKVSYIFWVPSIMVNIANMDLLREFNLPELKTVWFAGEVFPTKQFNYWKRNLQQTTFVNLYGPVEASVDCTYYIVNRDLKDDEPIPIGKPCRNTDVFLLDDKNNLDQNGEEGELCIRGTSLAMGYYNNPEKTAEVFIQNPLNKTYPEIIYKTGDVVYVNNHGEFVFKGRKDSLIKHLGYRIELGEIEHIIVNTLKLVDSGCVVYNNNKKEITLFYENSYEISIPEVKKKINAYFPRYMIPNAFIKMEELPKNENGKIDRLKLSNLVNYGKDNEL